MPAYRFSGARLRAARGDRSREEIAVRCNRSVSAITRAELEYHVPRVETLAELAAAVGVRIDDLLVLDQDAE